MKCMSIYSLNQTFQFVNSVVRHAVLFAVSMVILSVPGYILMSELQQEILESKQWLEGY